MNEDLSSAIKQIDSQTELVKNEHETLLAAREILAIYQNFAGGKTAPCTPKIIPGDLKLEKYQNQSLSRILRQVCRGRAGNFTVYDLVHEIYKINSDEELKACILSLNAALSRAVNPERFLEKKGWGIFALREP